jgi:uncharacterized protein YkwD
MNSGHEGATTETAIIRGFVPPASGGSKAQSFFNLSSCLRALVAGVFLFLASSAHANDDAFFQQTLALINQQRAKVKVQTITPDDKLMKIAGEWALKNAKADNMIHRKNLPSFVSDLNYSYMNENLFYAKDTANNAPTPEQVVTGWMNSTGHRKNMLKDRIDKIGLGIARAANGGYYVVFNGTDSHPPKKDETGSTQRR